jgi:hypothetical protein
MFKAIVGYITLDRFSSGADSFNGQSIAQKNNKAASQMLPNAFMGFSCTYARDYLRGGATRVWETHIKTRGSHNNNNREGNIWKQGQK